MPKEGMTVEELTRELQKYYNDRKVEIDCNGQLFVPVQVDWDADRRCLTLAVEPAPDIQEPYMYDDEFVCEECGLIADIENSVKRDDRYLCEQCGGGTWRAEILAVTSDQTKGKHIDTLYILTFDHKPTHEEIIEALTPGYGHVTRYEGDITRLGENTDSGF
jgi:hypothetical protein